MTLLPPGMKVHLALGYTDMRKGIDGLTMLVLGVLRQDPFAGPVVVGSFSDIAGGAYDVTGDTVNTASRLLGAAASGTILISDVTASMTRHRFAVEPAGKVTGSAVTRLQH